VDQVLRAIQSLSAGDHAPTVNLTLVGRTMRKFKRFHGRKVGAARFLEKMVQTHPVLFEHWRIDMIGAFA
jgi:hypothetical protein